MKIKTYTLDPDVDATNRLIEDVAADIVSEPLINDDGFRGRAFIYRLCTGWYRGDKVINQILEDFLNEGIFRMLMEIFDPCADIEVLENHGKDFYEKIPVAYKQELDFILDKRAKDGYLVF